MFQDEASFRLIPCVSKTYAPIGKTPILKCDSKNKKFVSVSGVISPNGSAYFEVRESEGFKQMGLVRFLNNTFAYALSKLLIIWDNAPSHKSKTIKSFLEKQSDTNPRIWLANTPPYSPELNPIEQVWAYAKAKLANTICKTTTELKQKVIQILNEIKEDPELVKSFFKGEQLEFYNFST